MNFEAVKALVQTECRYLLYREVDSTNNALKRNLALHKEHSGTPVVALAEQQSAGRGRLGSRTWESPEGNIYLSMMFAHACLSHLSALPLVIACALRTTLHEITSKYQTKHSELMSDLIKIKWPNDILCVHQSQHKKLAGILVEVVHDYVIVGVGINIKQANGPAPKQAAYLQDLMFASPKERLPELFAEELAAHAIDTIYTYVMTWQEEDYFFEPFRAEYERHAVLLDKNVVVRHVDGSVVAEGIVQGVDKEGRLLVQNEQGVIPLAAGDITLREP